LHSPPGMAEKRSRARRGKEGPDEYLLRRVLFFASITKFSGETFPLGRLFKKGSPGILSRTQSPTKKGKIFCRKRKCREKDPLDDETPFRIFQRLTSLLTMEPQASIFCYRKPRRIDDRTTDSARGKKNRAIAPTSFGFFHRRVKPPESCERCNLSSF